MAKSPIKITVDRHNTVYLKFTDTQIHPLIVFSDGLPVVTFGKSKTRYMRLDDVIAWHEKEAAEPHDQKVRIHRRLADALKVLRDNAARQLAAEATAQ